MRTSYSLLNQYLNISLPLEKLVPALTMQGLEVEKVIAYAQNIDKSFIVGEIKKKVKHPHADKLWICEVDIKKEVLQIICGASNFKENQKVVVAPIGTIMPNGITITKATLKGVESFGMLCSTKELGLFDSEGIWILPKDALVGESIAPYLPKADTILDMAITPNRGDLLSTMGIAKEIAILEKKKQINLPTFRVSTHKKDIPEINIKSSHCLRYTGRVIENITVQESPIWLKEALKKYNISSINNIVDLSNYVMMETGQPLHIFDLQKIKGKQINIENTTQKEKMETLTKQEIEIPKGALVIKDSNHILALAGIIGSFNCGVDFSTTTLFIEAAYFEPDIIRQTCQSLYISTDASYRFVRDTDITMTSYALDFVTYLINKEANGENSEIIDAYPKKKAERLITLSKEFLDKKLGFLIDSQKIEEILTLLQFSYTQKNNIYEIHIPFYRNDCHIPEDIIEEIIRIYGYENLPTNEVNIKTPLHDTGFKTPLIFTLKDLLVNIGLSETYHFSFLKKDVNDRFSIKNTAPITVQNPLNQDFTTMRSSLMAGNISYFLDQYKVGQKNFRTFEIGNVFQYEHETYSQQLHLALLFSGDKNPPYYNAKSSPVDFYDLKGVLEHLFYLYHISDVNYEYPREELSFLHPKKSAYILVNGKNIGFIGELHPEIYADHKITQEIFFCEIDLSLFENTMLEQRKESFTIPSKFPSTTRDFAFILDKDIPSLTLIKEIENISKLIKKVTLVDLYQDPKLVDKKSLAFCVVIQSEEKTLVEEEISLLSQKIISLMQSKYQAQLRDK